MPLTFLYEYSLRGFTASVCAEAQQLEFVALPTLAPALLVPALASKAGLVPLLWRIGASEGFRVPHSVRRGITDLS